MANIDKFSNIIGADLAKKVYEDGVSDAVKEAGKTGVDLVKVFRLFMTPFHFLANYQERLEKYLDRVRESVAEDQQMEAPASISGPILEKLKYLDENNYLTDFYLELLSRAINKERISEAHPAFFYLIEQLSPDEALILYHLKNKEKLPLNFSRDLNETKDQFGKYVFLDDLDIYKEIAFPDLYTMYIDHLQKMNILFWQKGAEDVIWNDPHDKKDQKGIISHDKIYLTRFGKLFVHACVPNKIIIRR